MTKIQILSDALISQIAAGEVIERPASAVKELVENSLDAGADQISVEIEEGGLKRIRVVDNGSGIRAGEARLALERHATSKIRQKEDLFHIQSLGFRGEALASIASIAHVELRTQHREERVGCFLEVDGGKELNFETFAGPHGTEINVWGLFKHTPARKKYMKSERTEYGRIFDLLCRIALAHPQVGFRLKRDEKVVFELAAGQSLKERIRTLYGGETAQALIPITYQQSNLMIAGFVGKPELALRSKKYQFLFVNGRAIENRSLHYAVTEAFHSLLMHEKHPWYVLDIHMDPAMVDVNVHPRKLEVKFLNEQEMFRAVRGAVHHALQGQLLSPVLESPSFETSEQGPQAAPRLLFPQSAPSAQRDFAPAPLASEKTFDLQGTVLRPVAQIANAYIVAESEEGLVLIDQHAAHERVRYARFMEALEKEVPMSQALLTPLELDLGVAGARFLEGNLEHFRALGFEIEPFGPRNYLLRSVPQGLEKRNPEALLKGMILDLKNNAAKDKREEILTMAACRGAIKFGDPLTLIEMQALLADMEVTKHCTHCPHGRPAVLTFTFDKLDTLFKRKNF